MWKSVIVLQNIYPHPWHFFSRTSLRVFHRRFRIFCPRSNPITDGRAGSMYSCEIATFSPLGIIIQLHVFLPFFRGFSHFWRGRANGKVYSIVPKCASWNSPCDHMESTRYLRKPRPPLGDVRDVSSISQAPCGGENFSGWEKKICSPSFRPPVILVPSPLRYDDPLCVDPSIRPLPCSYWFSQRKVLTWISAVVILWWRRRDRSADYFLALASGKLMWRCKSPSSCTRIEWRHNIYLLQVSIVAKWSRTRHL